MWDVLYCVHVSAHSLCGRERFDATSRKASPDRQRLARRMRSSTATIDFGSGDRRRSPCAASTFTLILPGHNDMLCGRVSF